MPRANAIYLQNTTESVMRYSTFVLAAILECTVAPGLADAADAATGEEISQRCVICHKFEKGSGNGLGPNLFGIVGRPAASLADFAYSDALKASKITWTTDSLAKWLQGPSAMVPGTKMVFPGITSKREIADLIAYLNTLK